jgi:hypothetical protein
MIGLRPHIEGIVYSTPSEHDLAQCSVELVSGPTGGNGWLLRDPQGRPLRRFFDTNGDKHIDVWSYYLDGIEVFREIDSNFDGKVDQYRWLNSSGMKWGLDTDQDGKIDSWKMISAEEVSQEILQAIITRDFQRLQALFISESEIKSLNLPPQEAARIRELQRQAASKFQATVTRLSTLNEKTHWLHLETVAPQCMPEDVSGPGQDIIRYDHGTILCETAGKNEWIQTGKMIRVGDAWRIFDAPSVGDGSSDGAATQVDPALQTLLDGLREHDAKAPKASDTSSANPDIVAYNLERANILERIVGKVKPEEREQWIRQVADCLGAAAQSSPETDKAAYQRLQRLETQIVAAMPRTGLAAYVTFREMQAENAARLAKPGPDVAKLQEQWLERLARFYEMYPKAEDAPEGLMQLGMVSEFVNKETEAKKWYGYLIRDFPDNPLALKAQGALRRLEIEGKPLELAGTLLDGSPFNIAQLRGKTVAVYYWASWNKERCASDFAALKMLLDSYSSKGFALVCVSLDNSASEAAGFVQRSDAPGIHVFQPGGLEGPLATQYGVLVLPNLFLVDPEGKVISRTIQVGSLEYELKRRLK